MSSLPPVPPDALLFELVPLPAADLDRSIAFYRDRLGFHLDVDVRPYDGVRIVQLTPPGSACSIGFTEGLADQNTPQAPLRGLHLVVADMAVARQRLVDAGVEISDVQDMGGVLYAWFADPDGNSWCLQHMPWR